MNSKPHIVFTVMIYALAILSAAAGVPKLLQMPQELDFLRNIGFSAAGVSMLGVLQLAGSILMFLKKSRLPGAVIVGIGFAVSSIAIFVGGNTVFGLIALLPVVVSIAIIGSLWQGTERSEV